MVPVYVASTQPRSQILPNQLIRPLDVSRKALSFTHELSFLFFFINPPRSAATQWTAIKCILEVRS